MRNGIASEGRIQGEVLAKLNQNISDCFVKYPGAYQLFGTESLLPGRVDITISIKYKGAVNLLRASGDLGQINNSPFADSFPGLNSDFASLFEKVKDIILTINKSAGESF